MNFMPSTTVFAGKPAQFVEQVAKEPGTEKPPANFNENIH
jgi:hypothetical protein